MAYDVLKSLREARKGSEFLREVSRAKGAFSLLSSKREALSKAGFKPLSTAQLRTLEAQGNTAQDWKSVFVAAGFDPKRVSRCHFAGTVLLPSFSGTVEAEGVSFPTGVHHSTLSACVIGRDAFVRDVQLLHRAVVGEKAVLFGVGSLTAASENSFGNGLECLIAIETGGREVGLFAELTVEGAWVLCRSRQKRDLLHSYGSELSAYLKEAASPCSVVASGAKVLHTPKVRGVFLGPSALIDSAALVEDVTVLSAPGEESEILSGSIVKSSILQWGCEVATG
ncbi:MAG: DUF4954 family protein, partial [Candidatus Omnitrophica bacterium]|nr:DUF4954 family protein [Candidatus Omnitrophota bacterium]